MKTRYLIILILVFDLLEIRGQTPQFSSSQAVAAYLNPASTAIGKELRLNTVFRSQWPSLQGSYSTYYFGVSDYSQLAKMTFGLYLLNDKQGSQFETTQATFSIAKSLRVADELQVNFGATANMRFLTVGENNGIYGDQYAALISNGALANSIDPTAAGTFRKSHFSASLGVMINNETTWLGAALQHINKDPKIIFFRDPTITLQAGKRFYLSQKSGRNTQSGTQSFILMGNYKHIGTFGFRQLDASLLFEDFDFPIGGGIGYRGLVFGENSDAAIAFLSLHENNFSFNIAYDLTISKLVSLSGGAFEFTANYAFNRLEDKQKAKKQNRRETLCPVFK